MCPGGITVLGIYAGRSVGTNASSLQTTAILARRALADDKSVSHALVLAATGKGRPVVRTIAVDDPADDGSKSGDVRTAAMFPLLIFKAYLDLDGVSVPTPVSATGTQLDLATANSIAKLVKRGAVSFQKNGESVFLVDETDDRGFSDICTTPAAGKGKNKPRSATRRKGSDSPKLPEAEQVPVQIALPLGPDPFDDEKDDETESDGARSATDGSETSIKLAGGMYVHAVLPANATVGQVLCAVREDIIRSLYARVRTMHDDADDDFGEPSDEEGTNAQVAKSKDEIETRLPVRVIARAMSGDSVRQLGMTEYMVKGETLEDAEARIAEVLSWTGDDLERASVEQVESEISEVASKSHEDESKQDDPTAEIARTIQPKTTDEISGNAAADNAENDSSDNERLLEGDPSQWMVNIFIAAVLIVFLAILLRQVI